MFKRCVPIAITSLFCVSCSAGVPDAGVMTVASTAEYKSEGSDTASPSSEAPSGESGPKYTPAEKYKSGDELTRYIECYLEPKSHENYKNSREAMRTVARVFRLPESYVECSFFLESRFSPTIVNWIYIRNKKGKIIGKRAPKQFCRGIAQINDNTVGKISDLISSKSSSKKPSSPERSLQIEGLDEAIAENDLIYGDLGKLWREYFEEIKMTPPRQFRKEDVTNPERAIPAGVIYQIYNLKMIADSLAKENGIDPTVESLSTNQDFLLAGTIAYNWGPGNLKSLLTKHSRKTGAPVTVAGLAQILASSSLPNETKNYINSVKTCMQAGNFESFIQGKSANNKKCEKP